MQRNLFLYEYESRNQLVLSSASYISVWIVKMHEISLSNTVIRLFILLTDIDHDLV